MSNFSATVPVKWAGEVNAKLADLGYGPSNFAVPASSAGATMSDFAGLHCWHMPAFQAAIAALDPAYGIVITEGNGVPNFTEACAKDGLTWNPYDGSNASLPKTGDLTTYEGKSWECLADYNPYAPPVNWREKPPAGTLPAWTQPTNAKDSYPLAFQVTHKGKNWESLIKDNVGVPGVSGWREVVATGYPAWVAPTGAHDAYKLQAKVSHNGFNWNNTGSDANVWEPGVFGWVKIA